MGAAPLAAFDEATRQTGAALLREHAESIVADWRAALAAELEGQDEATRQTILDGLLALFPVLCELTESGGWERPERLLTELAETAYRNRVPYVHLSRGLRLLKRQLMRRVVALLPAEPARDQVCDLLEEAIDECRVRVNQSYHTFHESRLRDSEALTRFLLNNTYDAIFLLSLETGRILMVNARAVDLTGRPQEELVGLPFADLVPHHRTDDVIDALRHITLSGVWRFDELPLLTKSGQAVPCLMRFNLVLEREQKRRAQVSVRDLAVDARTLAASELEAARLRAFVADTADAVILLDLDERIQSWNTGAEQIFGYCADEVLKRHVSLLLPAELIASGELDELGRMLDELGFVRNYETVRVTKDGRRLDVAITRTAVYDPLTGHRIGTSAVVRDVTEKRRLERETARKTRQLETVNRILEATSRSLDRDQTFRTIAAEMEGLLPCDALLVFLPEAEQDRLRCRVLIGDGRLIEGSEGLIEREATIHREAFARLQSFRIDELAEWSGAGRHDRELAALGYRSALVSPLVYNRECMGSLMLLDRRPAAYDELDQFQLDHLSNHFAVILENARRYEEERKRAAQFELISRVGAAAIANIGDVKRLMRSVVDTIQTDFGYYDVAIYEVDEDSATFRLRAQAGYRRGGLVDGFEQPHDVGVFGEVLRTQASYVANDTLTDPFYFNPTPGEGQVRAELCVPIRLGPRVYGVLDVESQRPNRFDRLDRAAMEALAGLLARCMEADESLRQTRMLQAMRHNIMEAVPSALILLDDELRVKFVNRRYCEFFNQEQQHILGQCVHEVLPPSLIDESRFPQLIERLKASLKPIDQREVRYFDFLGAERYVDVRLRIVTEYETNIIVMLHEATTRLKRLYQLSMLQEIGEEMQRTLDTDRLLRAILTCVTAGPGFGFNRAALFLYQPAQARLIEQMRVGPRTAEEAGSIWKQLGHKKTLREFLREYDQSQQLGPVKIGAERSPVVLPIEADEHQLRRWRAPLMLRRDDHSPAPLARALRDYSGAEEVLVVPLVSQENLLGLIVADNLYTGEVIDRDSIRMLTTFANQAGVALANAQAFEALADSLKELRETQDQLSRAERLAGIGSVAAHVAHEIRNPLVSIGGFARRLGDRARDAEYIASRSAIIVKEVERLEQILRNVADFTAPGQPELAPTRVNEIVEDVLNLQQPVIEEHRVTLAVDLATGLPAILADRDKLKQVVLNLVRNAIQAMGAEPRLGLATRLTEAGDGVEIEVRDNGVGIAADRLEEIFNPFFTNKADGTGLGLAVSRKIVVDHGGQLLVDSREGEGSTFVIRLPVPDDLPDGPEIGEKANGTAHSDR